MKPLILATVLCCICLSINAQKNNKKVKFGDVSAQDFEPKVYAIDTAAQAVILYDAGKASYVGNSDSWFNIVYTYHKRIRIMSKNAFDEATINIPLYKRDKFEDKISKLEAITYNIEGGEIKKTKIDKESIFSDKMSKDFESKKFTFPDIKEGCIIEYTYTIVSPIANNLRGWTFQDRFPVLQSEYDVTIPNVFDFVFLKSGYYDLQSTSSTSTQIFNILLTSNNGFGRSEMLNYNSPIVQSKWVLNDLPAMIGEKYTTTLRNHTSKIEFQLRSINLPDQPKQIILGTWDDLVKGLLKDPQFGEDLSSKNNWMDDDLDKLKVAGNQLTTARNIYKFVQQNFVCTDHDSKYLTSDLKKAYQAKKGNVAEVNLVLTAMLRKANILADPVLLSTRDNGFAYEQYPMVNKFNYVIARAMIDNKQYLLDASDKKMGFNFLPDYCYNGTGRIISEKPYLVSLSPDSLREDKYTSIFIFNDDKPNKLTGSFKSTLGYYESHELRDELTNSSKDDFFKKIKTGFNYDLNITNPIIDSLTNYETPAAITYDFNFDFDEDLVYYNPLMGEAYKTNPFTSATRNYPVEMPYATNEIITVNMEIPKGYKVDELPKSVRVSLNDNEGMFEYIIRQDAETILLRCRLTINKANFTPDDYETLRDFYGNVVTKQSEQIVFKKIK